MDDENYSETKRCCIETTKIFTYIVVGIGVVFLFPFMLGYSYKTVSPLHYGLLVDGNTFQIKYDKLYEGGRYYVGLNNYFLNFPRHNLYIHRIRDNIKKIGTKTHIFEGGIFVSDAITVRTK